MNILAVDTSTNYCSIAIKAGKNIVSNIAHIPQKHNEYLIHMLHELIKYSNITKYNFDIISYGVGPGSFVGVRLVASFMQSVSFIINKPVIGFSSMYAIAIYVYFKYKHKLITVILHAGVNNVYIGKYTFNNDKLRLLTVFEKCIAVEYLFKNLFVKDYGVLVGNVNDIFNIDIDIHEYIPSTQYMFLEIIKKYEELVMKNYRFKNDTPLYLQNI